MLVDMIGIRLLHRAALLMVAVTVIFLLVAVLTPSMGGNDITTPPGQLSAWAFAVLHPVAMILGFLLCASLGLTAYVSDLPGCCTRIVPDRSTRRLFHGIANFLAFALVSVGYLLHFSFAQANGRSHVAAGSDTWRQAHIWLGLITLAGVAVQVCVGMYKYVVKTRDNKSTMTWHGYLGITIWVFACVTIAVSSYGMFWATSNNRGVAVTVWVMLALLAVLTMAVIKLDPMRSARAANGDTRTFITDLRNNNMDGRYSGVYDGVRNSLGSLNSKPLL